MPAQGQDTSEIHGRLRPQGTWQTWESTQVGVHFMSQGPWRVLLPALSRLQQRAGRGEKRRDVLDGVHWVSWNSLGEGQAPGMTGEGWARSAFHSQDLGHSGLPVKGCTEGLALTPTPPSLWWGWWVGLTGVVSLLSPRLSETPMELGGQCQWFPRLPAGVSPRHSEKMAEPPHLRGVWRVTVLCSGSDPIS